MSEENNNQEQQERNQSQDSIIQYGSVTAQAVHGVIHCLTVIGKIVTIDNERKGF